MKLYTEEQLLQAYDLGLGLTDDEVLAEFTAIELPTDEEIEEDIFAKIQRESMRFPDSFTRGARWMRDKIKGGNK